VTLTFVLLTLKVVVRVTCDVGYLCANFRLPRPSVLDLGPMYVTDRRQTASPLNAPAYSGQGIITHNRRIHIDQ